MVFTGDIAFRFLQYLANERKLNSKNNNEIGERGHVTVSDINKSMLEVCEKKAQLLGYNEGIYYNLYVNYFKQITTQAWSKFL